MKSFIIEVPKKQTRHGLEWDFDLTKGQNAKLLKNKDKTMIIEVFSEDTIQDINFTNSKIIKTYITYSKAGGNKINYSTKKIIL